MKDIHIQEAFNRKDIRWIDVRSPGEYSTATIPGAVNVPLFTDDERARVGTLYKKQGREQAIHLGLELVSPKIPDFIRRIQAATEGKNPLFFCWRGGMRSQTMATFMDLIQQPPFRLIGGYRSYREWIKTSLKDYPLTAKMIVLHGLTGVGKTAVLHQLEALGAPVLDLEGMAGHRGSAFGSLGEVTPRNQRMFDSYLHLKLESLKDEPFIFMEAESKRIGRVHMPDFLIAAKEQGIPILLEASLASRTQHLLETYLDTETDPEGFHYEVKGALQRIERKLHPAIRKELNDAVHSRNYTFLVHTLLYQYYDPRYRHTQQFYEEQAYRRISSEQINQAARECFQLWKELKNQEKPAQAWK